jgi:hypothetical protein
LGFEGAYPKSSKHHAFFNAEYGEEGVCTEDGLTLSSAGCPYPEDMVSASADWNSLARSRLRFPTGPSPIGIGTPISPMNALEICTTWCEYEIVSAQGIDGTLRVS